MEVPDSVGCGKRIGPFCRPLWVVVTLWLCLSSNKLVTGFVVNPLDTAASLPPSPESVNSDLAALKAKSTHVTSEFNTSQEQPDNAPPPDVKYIDNGGLVAPLGENTLGKEIDSSIISHFEEIELKKAVSAQAESAGEPEASSSASSADVAQDAVTSPAAPGDVVLVTSRPKVTPSPPGVGCPADYKQRVETCIMEAKVAPQAGGGVSLVIGNDTIKDLCQRGMFRKTLDCLEDIRERCQYDVTKTEELDRLYSVPSWKEGEQLLCEDTDFIFANQECISASRMRIIHCVLYRTAIFRQGLADADPTDHAGKREVTCNFAESIVGCMRRPLQDQCPAGMTKRIAGAMFRFLPPFCHHDNYIPVTPQATLEGEGAMMMEGGGGDGDEDGGERLDTELENEEEDGVDEDEVVDEDDGYWDNDDDETVEFEEGDEEEQDDWKEDDDGEGADEYDEDDEETREEENYEEEIKVEGVGEKSIKEMEDEDDDNEKWEEDEYEEEDDMEEEEEEEDDDNDDEEDGWDEEENDYEEGDEDEEEERKENDEEIEVGDGMREISEG